MLATFAHCRDFPNEPWVHDPEFNWAYTESNEVLYDVSVETGAVLFDFANAFPNDKQYFVDGIHVTEEGAALKARLFAAFLEERTLIPPLHRRSADTE